MTGNTQQKTAATNANLSEIAVAAEKVDDEKPRAVLGFLTKVGRETTGAAGGHEELVHNAAEAGAEELDSTLSSESAPPTTRTVAKQHFDKVTRRLNNARNAEWFGN